MQQLSDDEDREEEEEEQEEEIEEEMEEEDHTKEANQDGGALLRFSCAWRAVVGKEVLPGARSALYKRRRLIYDYS